MKLELQRWSHDWTLPQSWGAPFPAAWWREVLPVDEVQLHVAANSPFTVVGQSFDGRREVLYRSDEDSLVPPISIRTHDWISIEAMRAADLDDITWSADVEVELPGVVAVVPTFRRETDATHQAATFLRSALITRVVVIDQGGTLHDHEAFGNLVSANPERLRLVEQQNLGGSGGYARGMIESLADPECSVLLSDDDAALPVEALRRMLVMQTLATRGGGRLVMATPMFSAEEPTSLVSAAERVDMGPFQWGAADGLREPMNVTSEPDLLLRTLAVHDSPNYAGWWGALLPPGMVEDVGLPAPYFLKWDDAEFGLRASRQGYGFRALPGTGVWHPTWGVQKTLTTWVAVLLHRNRLATAAAYGAGKGVIRDSLVHQIKHILSLQYDVAELWCAGIDQFLSGPDWLGSDISAARSVAQSAVDRLPRAELKGDVPERVRVAGIGGGTTRALVGLLRSARSAQETSCTEGRFTWRDGLGLDRVVITDESGTPVRELNRDPRRARLLLRRTISQHWSLMRRWRKLTSQYSESLGRTTTLAYWTGLLGIEA